MANLPNITPHLRSNPPKRSQFRSPRRAKPSGAIVVHTSESPADTVGPDRGAENVANYMEHRDSPGSYHGIVDSDSWLYLVDFRDEAYHEGTGGNRWSLGLSFALQKKQWDALPSKWVDDAVANGVLMALMMADYVESVTDVKIPARHITPAEYRAGKPGFIGHGELDPGRRSDPGVDFPWEDFLQKFAAGRDLLAADSSVGGTRNFAAIRRGSRNRAGVKKIQAIVGVTVDGDFGPKTEAAVKAYQRRLGVAADGVWGKNTQNAHMAAVTPPEPTKPSGSKPVSKPVVPPLPPADKAVTASVPVVKPGGLPVELRPLYDAVKELSAALEKLV